MLPARSLLCFPSQCRNPKQSANYKTNADMPRRREKAQNQHVIEFKRDRMDDIREAGLSYNDILARTRNAATTVMLVVNSGSRLHTIGKYHGHRTCTVL